MITGQIVFAASVLAVTGLMVWAIRAARVRESPPALTERHPWRHPVCCGESMTHIDLPWITDRLQCRQCGETCTCLADECARDA